MEQEERTCSLLKGFQGFGLVVNSGKNVFDPSEVKYLGYVVNTRGVRTDPVRLTTMVDYPRTTTVEG